MLDPIQYEFLFLFTTSADPEPQRSILENTDLNVNASSFQKEVPLTCGL